MKITIEATPQEMAQLIDAVQTQQRPLYIWGPGMEKFCKDNPDWSTEETDQGD